MKGIFIPEITVEMFRDGCLESIETLMTEGEVYDIEYDPKFEETDVPDTNVGDMISRQMAIEALERDEEYNADIPNRADGVRDAIITISSLPSAESKLKCDSCRYHNLEWYEEPCDSCTRGGEDCHYKPERKKV